ncbi:hypothetical protein PTKIN_Ptkin05aG0067000 [Pterospermum kingtungense]
MAEESKVRLVHCPKCKNLIKELPEYSIYKCGSCGAVLRAKKKEQASNGFVDKPIEEEKGGEGFEKADSQIDKGGGVCSASVTEIYRVEGISRRKERISGEKCMNMISNDSSREHRHKNNRTGKGVGYVGNDMPSSKNPMNSWGQRHDLDMNMNRSKSVNSCSRASKVGDYSPKLSNFARSLRLKGVEDMRGVNTYGFGGGVYKRSLGTISEQDRFSALRYPDEGPSSHRFGSVYGYHKPVKSFECLNVPNGVQNFDDDRAQLLEKLDELKEQLSRSHLTKLTHLDHLSKPVYSKIPYEDCLSPGMHRRPQHHVFHHHHQQRTYGYSSRQYVDFNEDRLASYPNPDETLYHLPSCSCQVPPSGYSNRRFLKEPCSSTFNHCVDSDGVGQYYLPRAAQYPQLNFQDPPVHVWPSDIDSDIDGFGRRCPRKVVLTCRNKQLCHPIPIANGAPFITCYKCLELLKLPRNFRKIMKNDKRLRCGACSTVMVFETDNKRLIISAPGKPEQGPTEAEEKPSEFLNEKIRYDQTTYKEEKSPDNVIDWRDSHGSSELPLSSDVTPTVSSLPIQEQQVNNQSSNQAVRGFLSGNRKKDIQVKSISQVVSEKNAPVPTEVEVSFSGYINTSSTTRDSLEASKEENQLKLHKGSKSFLVGLIKKSFRDFSRSSDKVKNETPNVSANGQHISDCSWKC